jgi:UDP-N-acetylmuramoylalanine--D-glutamate ligase
LDCGGDPGIVYADDPEIEMKDYQDKKVTVVGLGRSGRAAAWLLNSLGARVSVTEEKSSSDFIDLARSLEAEGISVELGRHSPSFIEDRDLIVVSPGVRCDSRPCLWAQNSGIELISEIELGFSLCPAPVIAITGTNGKTTTTTLLGEVMRSCGFNAHVLGNIGTSFTECVLEIKKQDYVCLEVSSFQLERIKRFHPHVAVILNLTPDHLDRYKSLNEYYEAKARICWNQGPLDWVVLNSENAFLKAMALRVNSQVVFFDRFQEAGRRFDQNQLAVLACAKILKIEDDVVFEVFERFKGIEHRFESLGEVGGVEFINDSKATNMDSTAWALNHLTRPAVLIVGGRDKGSDFSGLRDLVRRKVKAAILVGEASERIAQAWEGALPCIQTKDFQSAVHLAYQQARPGECVLLSPMCKSFDMFKDYEHRGRVFKEIVERKFGTHPIFLDAGRGT